MPCSSCGQKSRSHATYTTAAVPGTDTLVRPKAGFTPSVYRFEDEQQPAVKFEDTDLDLLLARIVQYRHENKLPAIAYLKDVVVNHTMTTDENYTAFTEHFTPDPQVHLSAKQYIKSAIAFAKAALTPDEDLFVPQDEAERRALVCLNCPRNVQFLNGHDANSPTLAQSQFCQLAEGKTTTVDGSLGLCGVCTCVNKCKVHFNKEFIRKSATKELLGQFDQQYIGRNGKIHTCWISEKA